MWISVKFSNMAQVQKLSELASKEETPIYVHSGNAIVDARSLLAVSSMVGNDCKLVLEDDGDPKILEKIVKKLKIGLDNHKKMCYN